jgi:hypothetical protein
MKTWLDMVWGDYRSASKLVLGCFCAFAPRKGPLRYERRKKYGTSWRRGIGNKEVERQRDWDKIAFVI